MLLCRNKRIRPARRSTALALMMSVLVVTCASCAGGSLPAAEPPEPLVYGEAVNLAGTDGIYTIAANERYRMQYRQETTGIEILDAAGMPLWSSTADRERYDWMTASDVWRHYLCSFLHISYIHKDNTRGQLLDAYSGDPDTTIQGYALPDGVRLRIQFGTAAVTMVMDVVLEENGISVCLPEAGIEENGDYLLVSAEVFAFLGAASKSDEGYLVYPDQGGAITYFDRVDQKNTFASSLSLEVYGPMDAAELFEEPQEYATANLPAFGLKRNSEAFLAAAVSGDSDLTIEVRPALETSAVPLNAASFRFVYRQSYKIYLSGLDTEKNGISYGTQFGDLIGGSREAKYFFLSGDEANYSSMAAVYRKYLLETGQLSSSANAGNELALTILIGTKNVRSALGGTICMTTFAQAQQMIEDYLQAGIPLRVMLRGWTQGGSQAAHSSFQPSKAAGGEKNGVPVALEVDAVQLTEASDGLRPKKDGLLQGSLELVCDEEETSYLLSPVRTQSLYQRLQKQLSKYGLSDTPTAWVGIGQLCHEDYRKNAVCSRAQCIDIFSGIAGDMVQGANLYALKGKSWVYDVWMRGDMHRISDVQIPWTAMVLSGSVGMISTAGNDTGDLQELEMQWLEYGCVPSFELTWESASKLQDSNVTSLYSSGHSQWKDTIISFWQQWEEGPGATAGHALCGHTILSDGVVRVQYEDTPPIYINRTAEPVTVDGLEIPAGGYRMADIREVIADDGTE